MVNRVLLADDSATIQKLVEMALSDSDFELLAVSDGKQAVDNLASFQPDIILADAIMPALNGYEVCAHVKGDPASRNIPVVLLTGRFQPYDKEQAERVGVDEKIVKPFSQDQLVSVMTRLIESSQASRAAEAPRGDEGEPVTEPEHEPEMVETGFDEGATIQASPEELRASLGLAPEPEEVPEIEAFDLGEPVEEEPMELATEDLEDIGDDLEVVDEDLDDELELSDEDFVPAEDELEETISLESQPFSELPTASAFEEAAEAEVDIPEHVEIEELSFSDDDFEVEEDTGPDGEQEETEPVLGEDTEPGLEPFKREDLEDAGFEESPVALGEDTEPSLEPLVDDELSLEEDQEELLFAGEDLAEEEAPLLEADEAVAPQPIHSEADTVELNEREMQEIREAAQSADLSEEDFDLELEDEAIAPVIEEVEEPLLGDVIEELEEEAHEVSETVEPSPWAADSAPSSDVLLEEDSVLEDIEEENEAEPLLATDLDEQVLEVLDSDVTPAPEPSEIPSVTAPDEGEPDHAETEAGPATEIEEDTASPPPITGDISLTDEQLRQIADKVVTHLVDTVGTDYIREVIWQVVPELAEAMIKKRIYQLEQSVDES